MKPKFLGLGEFAKARPKADEVIPDNTSSSLHDVLTVKHQLKSITNNQAQGSVFLSLLKKRDNGKS